MDSEKFPIHNDVRSQLNKVIFDSIIKMIKEDDLESVSALGLCEDTLELFLTLSHAQVSMLAEDRSPFVFVDISDKKLRYSMSKIEHRTNIDRLTKELIKRHATNDLIYHLVNMPRNKVGALRKRLGVVNRRGNIDKLSPEKEKEVRSIWSSLKDHDLMTRCVLLSDQSGLMLDQLWRYIEGDIHPIY